VTYHFQDADITALENLLAKLLPQPKTLERLAKQAGVPGDVIDPDGQMIDRWFAVVEAAQARESDGCLTRLLELAQRQLEGTDEGRNLDNLIKLAIQNQSSADRDSANAAVVAIRDAVERLRDLAEPISSEEICGDIRREVRTVWRLLENEGTAASLTVTVGVVRESSRVTRDLLINACMELVSAVDRLRGRIGMGSAMPEDTGSTLRDTHQDVLRATYRLDAVIDARDAAIRRGTRLLKLFDEYLLLTSSRAHLP
jgi:hypothetical protein